MKRNRWTSDSPHKALRLALASATLLSLAAAPSMAADVTAAASPSTSGVYVTILSPNPGTSLAGSSKIEISAYYESSYGVSSIDLFIDGRRMATQRLTSPEDRGEISFVVDADALRGGQHTIVIRATATDEEVASARTLLNLPVGGSDYAPVATPSAPVTGDASQGSSVDSQSGPSISVVDPAGEATVSGIVRIKVSATDPSGKSPYVSLFVDHAFKTLRNFPPYTFDWDTTRLPNGYHTIEVLGYNDAQQVGQASPIRVMVNNPGGRTFERHDLSDTPDFAPAAPAGVRHAAVGAKSPKVAATSEVKRRGFPMIAHAVKRTISGLISRADKLASIDSAAAPLGAASVDGSLVAPVIGGKTAPAAEVTHSRTLKLQIRATVKPAYTISTAGRPAMAVVPVTDVASEQPARALRLDGIGSPDLSDLDSAGIETSLIAPHVSSQSTAIKGIRVESLRSAAIEPAVEPQRTERLASANIGEAGAAIGERAITTPSVDISRIKAAAVSAIPTITSREVTIGRLTEADLQNVRGEYQVVIDDQRVELDRPMQDRGSVLFAPLRQIFESQGGQLNWDQAKRQVTAVSQTKEIVVTIGSKHALVNNQPVRMTGAPYLYNSRTMLPLDFVAVAMDARVSYDAATGHVVIESR